MKRHFLISAILMSLMFVTSAFGQTSNPSGVKAVNIGLSVRWADRNVGADSPSDYGDYYAWGEVKTKTKHFSWETYKWFSLATRLTKYNAESEFGSVDNKTMLELEDDVAHVKLGGTWRMPTVGEVNELMATKDNLSYKWEWTQISGHNGWQVTCLVNNQSIFLPAAGCYGVASLEDVGSLGIIWSSSLYAGYPCAWGMYYYSGNVFGYRVSRNLGASVRPVTD